jgi:Sigma-70 region 2
MQLDLRDPIEEEPVLGWRNPPDGDDDTHGTNHVPRQSRWIKQRKMRKPLVGSAREHSGARSNGFPGDCLFAYTKNFRFLRKYLLTLARRVAIANMSDPTQDDSDASFVTQLTVHQLALNLYVCSLLPGNPAVCDVLQQTNANLWEKRSEFRVGTNFKAWSFSVARYEVLNHRKSQARNSKLVFSSDLEEVFL